MAHIFFFIDRIWLTILMIAIIRISWGKVGGQETTTRMIWPIQKGKIKKEQGRSGCELIMNDYEWIKWIEWMVGWMASDESVTRLDSIQIARLMQRLVCSLQCIEANAEFTCITQIGSSCPSNMTTMMTGQKSRASLFEQTSKCWASSRWRLIWNASEARIWNEIEVLEI